MNQSNDLSEGKVVEALEIIREEQDSPTILSVSLIDSKQPAEEVKIDLMEECICKKHDEHVKGLIGPTQLKEILKKKEEELRADYEKLLERENALNKERFDLILENEQIRASHMLREAHRERQEKILALQSQLECKNLAALMYVMCTERRRSKLEKLKIIEDYTAYIGVLQNVLTEGQELILHLSRGYKTAARVDHEWREKMKKVVSEFLSFIYHFAGGDPETNQFLIDLPKLLKTEAPIVDNPQEDPCDCDDEEENMDKTVQEIPHKKAWYEDLDSEHRPFIMFGDMADFKAERRREVLKRVKAPKTAPKKWKEYAFGDNMFFKSTCANMNKIKDLYKAKLPVPVKWECIPAPETSGALNEDKIISKRASKLSIAAATANQPTANADIRGNMGSILKMISSVPHPKPVSDKIELLGARDSMEIMSTTRLRKRNSLKSEEDDPELKDVVIIIGKKRSSESNEGGQEKSDVSVKPTVSVSAANENEKTNYDDKISNLGSIHVDSLHVAQPRVPEPGHVINYERVCPMEQCQHLQVDSFMRSLPPYMRANPFTHFEQTFDQYETCTPEQLEMLKQRIELKKQRETEVEEKVSENPLSEWMSTGVAVQTSDDFLSLPPCTCHVPTPASQTSNFILNVKDLLPVKLAMDDIQREFLFDDRINFNRFELIGQNKDSREHFQVQDINKEFKLSRYDSIKKTLKQHPSLLDIFQANAR